MTNIVNPKIGCVIMAAGNSVRFGGNKLTAVLNDKTVAEHAFDAVPPERFHSVVTVTQYDSVASLSRKYGFDCVYNDRPEDGISLTIRLGTRVLMKECDAILYMVSDQPLLKRESVSKILDCYLDHPDCIISAAYGGKRGNPCLFPRKFFDLLLNLKGDTGGSSIIREHTQELILCEIEEEELTDVDTMGDIARLERPR